MWVGVYAAHVGSRPSVQRVKRRGKFEQACRYRRDGVVVQVPAVYTAVDGKTTPQRRHRGYKSYTATMPGWHRGKARRQADSEHAGRTGDAVAENGGGRPRCRRGWAATALPGPCWDEGVSVQSPECRVIVQQARWDRREVGVDTLVVTAVIIGRRRARRNAGPAA